MARVYPKMGWPRHPPADADGLVGGPHMQRLAVRIRIDRDDAKPKAARGTHDAQRDLAAIGDQDGAERRALHRPTAPGRAIENCMRCGLRASASRQIASTSARMPRELPASITSSSRHHAPVA